MRWVGLRKVWKSLQLCNQPSVFISAARMIVRISATNCPSSDWPPAERAMRWFDNLDDPEDLKLAAPRAVKYRFG
jgi:hypothetical protein